MIVTTAELLRFLRTQRLAVQASRAPDGAAQAALIGIGVTDRFEIVFDTIDTTRKVQNLRTSPRIALVIGGWVSGDERTVQYEGITDEPTGSALERAKAAYFDAWPDGPSRAHWPGLIYMRVRPLWTRYSDFNQRPALIAEFQGEELGS